MERLDSSLRLPHQRESQQVLTIEDALLVSDIPISCAPCLKIFLRRWLQMGFSLIVCFVQLVSKSVKRVVLDAKVGPPLHEKGLAKDILSTVSLPWCLLPN